MTSFNVESTFLDLKKTYQHFEYTDLGGEGVVGQEEGGEAYEGMTQNTYLLVQERTVLAKDVQNLALWFGATYCGAGGVAEAARSAFPTERVRDRLCFIFQKYQEQPTLLDSLLDALVRPLMDTISCYLQLLLRSGDSPCPPFHSLLEVVYQLTKVRGDKRVIQHFPHEVRDLYPALAYLVRERHDLTLHWQSRYVVLLWLGVIALVPFDLAIIDSGVLQLPTAQGPLTHIVDLLVEVPRLYLSSLTKMREAAATFLGKLFTRPDIQSQGVLTKYIHNTLTQLHAQDTLLDCFSVCGLYDSLCSIFRLVQRSELLPLIHPVLDLLRKDHLLPNNGTKRELMVRLLTSIGLVYLQPRTVSWAYRRQKQSLRANLSSSFGGNLQSNATSKVNSVHTTAPQASSVQSEAEYYGDVHKQNLEEILGMLIDMLGAKETSVREEASKGLGLVAGRLSQDMVQDMVEYILELYPTPQLQHATCLTLAQLIRRNLLSPKKLQQLYPKIGQWLLYEVEEGGYSVGQAVRDAACYMTWSVARGYEQGGCSLGVPLMLAACFDREVGCRRAASAAYQQLVGRVGDVPNGIEVLTEADYFTLGLQKNAFLNVAIFVASYPPYFKPFVEHLCHQKLRHWDVEMKRISACSLSLMCPLNPHFMAEEVLPALMKSLDSPQASVKLGGIIGTGEVLLGLKGYSHLHQLHDQMKDSVFLRSLTQNQKKLLKAGEYMEIFRGEYEQTRRRDNFNMISPSILEGLVQNLRAKLSHKQLFKGKAGEHFRIYTCRLLECFAICAVPLDRTAVEQFRDFIEENMKHPQQPVLFAAVHCLRPFLTQYYHSEKDGKFIMSMIHQARSTKPHSRSYTLALSKLTRAAYIDKFDDLLSVCRTNTLITKENNDPQKRKYALMTLETLVSDVGFKRIGREQMRNIFDILFTTVEDYAIDKRGDIGSIVREQSMNTLMKCIELYVRCESRDGEVTVAMAQRVVGVILQQLCEKIDRVRLVAGSLLQKYFDQLSACFQIADRQQLANKFGQENIRKLLQQNEKRVDNNLDTDVIRMQMRIQQTIFHSNSDRTLIYFWNLPHAVFPVVIPLLSLPAYRAYILKGLCTSTGGISESTIKHSLQELGRYVNDLFARQADNELAGFFEEVLRLLEVAAKDERILIPLYKTLDFLLERDQITRWPGLRAFDVRLFTLLHAATAKSQRINKVCAAVGLYVSLLNLNNEATKTQIISTIVMLLCSDLPKARKILADKLMLFLMSLEDFALFTEKQCQQIMELLSAHDFLDEKLQVEAIRDQMHWILMP